MRGLGELDERTMGRPLPIFTQVQEAAILRVWHYLNTYETNYQSKKPWYLDWMNRRNHFEALTCRIAQTGVVEDVTPGIASFWHLFTSNRYYTHMKNFFSVFPKGQPLDLKTWIAFFDLYAKSSVADIEQQQAVFMQIIERIRQEGRLREFIVPFSQIICKLACSSENRHKDQASWILSRLTPDQRIAVGIQSVADGDSAHEELCQDFLEACKGGTNCFDLLEDNTLRFLIKQLCSGRYGNPALFFTYCLSRPTLREEIYQTCIPQWKDYQEKTCSLEELSRGIILKCVSEPENVHVMEVLKQAIQEISLEGVSVEERRWYFAMRLHLEKACGRQNWNDIPAEWFDGAAKLIRPDVDCVKTAHTLQLYDLMCLDPNGAFLLWKEFLEDALKIRDFTEQKVELCGRVLKVFNGNQSSDEIMYLHSLNLTKICMGPLCALLEQIQWCLESNEILNAFEELNERLQDVLEMTLGILFQYVFSSGLVVTDEELTLMETAMNALDDRWLSRQAWQDKSLILQRCERNPEGLRDFEQKGHTPESLSDDPVHMELLKGYCVAIACRNTRNVRLPAAPAGGGVGVAPSNPGFVLTFKAESAQCDVLARRDAASSWSTAARRGIV